MLWQKARGQELPQVVEQVWFPGAHSNVGGGWSDTSVADLALGWMIRRVQVHSDLAFDEAYIAQTLRPDPLGKISDSRTALYALSRIWPFERRLGQHPTLGPGARTWRSSSGDRSRAPIARSPTASSSTR